MPVTAAVVGGGMSLAGGFIGNQSSQNTSGTSMPTVSPGYSPLQNMILNQTMGRLSQPVDMTGYTANGLENNNAAFAGANANLQNTLTAKGLGGSPVAGAGAATIQAGRAASGAQFLNSIPLVQNQLEDQNIALAEGVLGQGLGHTTTGTGTTTTGGGAGGAATSLAGYLGYLQGKGLFKNSTNNNNPATPGSFSPGTDYSGSY